VKPEAVGGSTKRGQQRASYTPKNEIGCDTAIEPTKMFLKDIHWLQPQNILVS
jgi:hypothetical protein